MNVLVIYSHPYAKSFNHALKDSVEKSFKSCGCDVRIRDLYADGFNPILSADDLAGIRQGKSSSDIQKEQEQIVWSNTIVVIHPIWWTGLPAMMKGYIDRVFSFGFAYTYENGEPKGLLTGKKVFIINTTGAPYDYYAQIGMHEAIKRTSDEGIYGFCGLEVVGHMFLGAVPAVTDDVRKRYLADVEKKIKDYFSQS